MIAFTAESWFIIQPEVAALVPFHYKEIALNQNEIPLDPDWKRYNEIAFQDALHCVTVRDDGRLVGYHLTIVSSMLHYKSTLAGITDVYYILPEYRKGMTGIKLMREVEDTLKERGVKILITATKKHLDLTPIFERLGYKAVETVFKKVIR